MEKIDIETIGKHDKKSSVTLMTTYIKKSEGTALSTDAYLTDNDDIVPILIHKINELVERINDFHGINVKEE